MLDSVPTASYSPRCARRPIFQWRHKKEIAWRTHPAARPTHRCAQRWFAGSIVAPWAKAGGSMDFTKLFSVPMWMALGCFVVMLEGYPGGSPKRSAAN